MKLFLHSSVLLCLAFVMLRENIIDQIDQVNLSQLASLCFFWERLLFAKELLTELVPRWRHFFKWWQIYASGGDHLIDSCLFSGSGTLSVWAEMCQCKSSNAESWTIPETQECVSHLTQSPRDGESIWVWRCFGDCQLCFGGLTLIYCQWHPHTIARDTEIEDKSKYRQRIWMLIDIQLYND